MHKAKTLKNISFMDMGEAAVRQWVKANPDSIDALDEDNKTPLWAMVVCDELAMAT